MESDAPIEIFGFLMDILYSIIRPTTVNKLAVTALQHIMTPLFTTLDIFSLIVPDIFDV